MDVGLVVYGDLDNVSGGYLYDRNLVAHLRDRGDDVDVIALSRRSYPRNLLDGASPGLAARLRGYDVLVQDELCHPSLVGPNRRLDGPIVSIVHSPRFAEARTAWRTRLHRAVEGRYLAGVDGVVCPSRATLSAVAPFVDAPHLVAPPGRGHRTPEVTAEDVAERARSTPLRILFVGNVIPRKGAATLVDGLARLPRGSWRLTVVGSLAADRSYVETLRRRIDRNGVADAVTLAGRLPDERLDSLFAAHHLVAVPSTYEAFGIVYLEGMGFGLPALATTAGGADEVVSHGENGFLIPPDDPRSIARRLRPLVADRGRLRDLGLAALRTYEAHPSWTETARRVRRFLRERVE